MNTPQNIIKTSSIIIFDSDGVLLEGGRPLPGAKSLTQYLSSIGKKIVVFSNNSTKHPEDMLQTYVNFDINVDEILNSGLLAVNYCLDEQISKVFVIGEAGFSQLLIDNNIEVVEREDSFVQAVLVGMDRTLTYDKLAIATRMIRSGVRFIATNPDPSFPTPRGLEPGAGSMVAALEASTDQRPEIILGKPNSYGFTYILNKYGVNQSDVCMIGDRYETDIIGAMKLSIPAFIVKTGVAKSRLNPGKYENYPEVPVVDSLSELHPN